MIIANIIGLGVAAVFCTVCFIGWLNAEMKLAKHNESTIFKEIKK